MAAHPSGWIVILGPPIGEPTIKRWVDPTFGIRCAIRQFPGGPWCGYVDVPTDLDLDAVKPCRDWTGGFEGMVGFDMGHKDDYRIANGKIIYDRNEGDVTREVFRLAQAFGELRDAALPWPRWRDETGAMTLAGGMVITLVLRDKPENGIGTLIAGVRKEFKARSFQMTWWVNQPKFKSGRAKEMSEVVAAFQSRGIVSIPDRLREAFDVWAPAPTR
jgi:hypothetical protein